MTNKTNGGALSGTKLIKAADIENDIFLSALDLHLHGAAHFAAHGAHGGVRAGGDDTCRDRHPAGHRQRSDVVFRIGKRRGVHRCGVRRRSGMGASRRPRRRDDNRAELLHGFAGAAGIRSAQAACSVEA